MRIHDIQAIGLAGATPKGGWSEELRPEYTVHTLVIVRTDEGLSGTGSVFTNRAAAYSGVPAIIGWGWHETQWRNGQPEIAEITPRQDAVQSIYADPASPAVERYDVTYLYVGRIERGGVGEDCRDAGPYPEVAEPGYPGDGWVPVFSQGEVAIYRRDSRSGAALTPLWRPAYTLAKSVSGCGAAW